MYSDYQQSSNQMLVLNIVEAGGVTEPVTLAEAKDHMHISYSDDDTWITAEIKAARQALEKFLGLSLVAKTIEWHGRNPGGYSELPYGPVLTIVTFKDSEGNTIATPDYELSGILGDFVQIVSPASDLLKVTYTAGYTTANIPSALKTEIKNMVAWEDLLRAGAVTGVYQFSNKARSYRRVPVIL